MVGKSDSSCHSSACVQPFLLFLALLARPMLAFGGEIGPVQVDAKGYAEVRSAYYSRGNIVNNGPILPLFGEATVTLGKFGRLGGGVFTVNELTSGCNSYDCRNAFNEVDLNARYGYDWNFGNGWSLDSTACYQWVLWPGYRRNPPVRHEWHIGQSLKNPYVTPYYLWRHAYSGAKWNYWRVGLVRAFPLGHGFVFRPRFWCDFGDANLYTVQYGRASTDGLMALNGELRLEWWFVENLAIHFAVHQFDVATASGRAAVNENGRIQATTDLTIFTLGLTAKF